MKSMGIRGKQVPVAIVGALLILAGAGAAAGVTMQGNVEGDTTTKVDQAITANGINSTDEPNNALGTASDDGTKFKHSANINQGDEYTININLTNQGNQTINGRLVLDVPEPVEVEVAGNDSSGVAVARTSMYKWQFQLDSGGTSAHDNIQITVATPDDIEPGFYTIEGEIRPEEV